MQKDSRIIPSLDTTTALLQIPSQDSTSDKQLFKRHEFLDPGCTVRSDECGSVVCLWLRERSVFVGGVWKGGTYLDVEIDGAVVFDAVSRQK
jgi:hypothetical protein